MGMIEDNFGKKADGTDPEIIFDPDENGNRWIVDGKRYPCSKAYQSEQSKIAYEKELAQLPPFKRSIKRITDTTITVLFMMMFYTIASFPIVLLINLVK